MGKIFHAAFEENPLSNYAASSEPSPIVEVGKTLRLTTRKAWRTWLAKNHASRKEIWLVYPLKHTGKRRIPSNDAVEEALCFGWIDSVIKKIDAGRVAQRFTPRRS